MGTIGTFKGSKFKAGTRHEHAKPAIETGKAMVSAYADRLDPLQDIEAILKDFSGDLASGFKN